LSLFLLLLTAPVSASAQAGSSPVPASKPPFALGTPGQPFDGLPAGAGERKRPVARIACAATSTPRAELREVVIRKATRSSGAEMTEFRRDGSYRVTRCDRRGQLLRSQNVHPARTKKGGRIMVPDETTVRVGHRRYRTAAPTYPAVLGDTARLRRRLRRAVTPPTRGRRVWRRSAATPDRRRARASYDSVACNNLSYGYINGIRMYWPSYGYTYYIASPYAGIGSDTYWGHWVWNHRYNDCSSSTHLASPWFNAAHGGYTGLTAVARDGVNLVTGGNASAWCAGPALACTLNWTRPAGSKHVIEETDQIYTPHGTQLADGTVVLWANGRPPNYNEFDFLSVVAHESGHSLGAGHAADLSRQTMEGTIATGTTHVRTLGYGDFSIIRNLYYQP
jgi:hypothetical protein